MARTPARAIRALCLLPRDCVDFVLAPQPTGWQKLAQHHGAAVKEQFLRRLSSEIERRGALDVLRIGIKDSGCKFRLAYFRPASGLNEETRRLHAANLFAAISMALRMIRGIERRDQVMACDVLREGIAAEQFLSLDHTRRWFREEFHFPGPAIDRTVGDVWVAQGQRTAAERAHEVVVRLLAGERSPPLAADVERELDELMRARSGRASGHIARYPEASGPNGYEQNER